MIIINVLGLALVALIIWWFWLSKPKAIKSDDKVIHIDVKDGVYHPARIEVKANTPISLEFLRIDASGCAEYVLFETLGVHEKLPLNKPHIINLGKLKPGNYPCSCQMKMYQGELIVRK